MALINTIHGPMEESLLQRRSGEYSNDNEDCQWVEYWLDGVLVHRSAAVQLKKPAEAVGAEAGAFST